MGKQMRFEVPPRPASPSPPLPLPPKVHQVPSQNFALDGSRPRSPRCVGRSRLLVSVRLALPIPRPTMPLAPNGHSEWMSRPQADWLRAPRYWTPPAQQRGVWHEAYACWSGLCARNHRRTRKQSSGATVARNRRYPSIAQTVVV
jgi:hypothetical protein